jgi:multisubunit Na+/H+ antiporter MnhE subunit
VSARFGAVAGLAIVYLLVLGSVHPWDAVIGLALGAVATRGVRCVPRAVPVSLPSRRDEGPHPLWRALTFFPFALAVAADIVRGTARIARLVVGGGPAPPAGIAELPIHARTGLGVAVTALVVTVTPGSVVIDADWQRRALRVHTADIRIADALRASQRRLYERWQRHVFP